MRLFTGLSLPSDASRETAALIRRLSPLAHLAWTREEKLHVTTKFIGEWPEARLPDLHQALAGVRIPGPVDVQIRGLVWLPHMLFAAVEPVEPLLALVTATEAALEPMGMPREIRAYRPHVTLARVRRKQHVPASLREATKIAFDLPPFRAEAFHLYISSGGTYTKLEAYPLTA